MTDGIAKRTFAASQSSRLSERIHWVTVAVVVVLLILSFFGHIDPHGPGNRAFRWHSALGIILYLLAGARLMQRLIRRPPGHPADATTANSMLSTASRLAFYTLLVALPISGWILASEEGRGAHGSARAPRITAVALFDGGVTIR